MYTIIVINHLLLLVFSLATDKVAKIGMVDSLVVLLVRIGWNSMINILHLLLVLSLPINEVSKV